MENLSIIDLASFLQDEFNNTHECIPKSIILEGIPASGKSFICKYLSTNNIAGHIEMESYFKTSRKERRKNKTNGFDLHTYNLYNIERDYILRNNNKIFSIQEYEPSIGFTKNIKKIQPNKNIIYEGFAFNILYIKQNLQNCIDNYFLYPDNILDWFDIHIQRDRRERNSNLSYLESASEIKLKAISLSNSMNNFQNILPSIRFIKVRYGTNMMNNKYTFVKSIKGIKFLNDINKL